MRYLFPIFLLLLLPWRAVGATGDIIAANVCADGYTIAVTYSGMATNGATDTGLGQYKQAVEAAKLKLAVTRQTLGTNGALGTLVETLIGQQVMRYPYPGQGLVDTSLSGSDCVVRYALSDYVFSGDSNLVLTAGSGLYTSTNAGPTIVSSAASASFTVVNNSTVGYVPPVGTWTINDRQLITNTTFNLKAFAMSRCAKDRRNPVKAMRFWISDGTTSLTNIEVQCKRDFLSPDQRVVCEYISTFVVSNLTQGATLTANWEAIPWVGTNTLRTDDGVYAEPSARYRTFRFVNNWKQETDPPNAYGISIAVVDPVAGSNTVAKVQRIQDWQSSPTTNYFSTIKAAANAIVSSNNTSGFWAATRNDHGGGIIYVRSGHYAGYGDNTSPTGNMPETYLTIAAHPSDSRDTVIFDGVSGNTQLKKRIQFYGVTLSKTNTSYLVGADSLVWFNRCLFDQTAANWGSSVTNWSVTWSEFRNFPPLTPTGGPMTGSLFRGNLMDRWVGPITANTIIGNLRIHTNSVAARLIENDRSGTNEESTNNVVVAFNSIYGVNQTLADAMTFWANSDNAVTGSLIVQNEVESTGDGVNCWMTMANGSSGSFQNVLEAYNTGLGKTISHYNDSGSTGPTWKLGLRANSIHANDNLKSDTFTTGNGGRTNNWSLMFGINYWKVYFPEIEPVGAAASFRHDSMGLFGLQNSSPTTNAVMKFFRVNYFAGGIWGTDTAGDYRLHSTDMSHNLSGGRPGFMGLPYDLYGTPRTPYDPPGAIVSGVLKTGAGGWM